MTNRVWLLLILLIAALPVACGSVISKSIRENVNRSLSFEQVLKNPDAYKGQTVIWGGEIIKIENQSDGVTFIEVYQRPLGSKESPDIDKRSNGRFIVKSTRYLDPYAFKAGKKITMGGVILGEEVKPIGKMSYHYPLILAEQIYLWRNSYFYNTSPYYYEPWWGYPDQGFGDEDFDEDFDMKTLMPIGISIMILTKIIV